MNITIIFVLSFILVYGISKHINNNVQDNKIKETLEQLRDNNKKFEEERQDKIEKEDAKREEERIEREKQLEKKE